MIKKIRLVTLLLVCALLFSACGKKEAETVSKPDTDIATIENTQTEAPADDVQAEEPKAEDVQAEEPETEVKEEAKEEAKEEPQEEGPVLPEYGLAEFYKDYFYIGVALPSGVVGNKAMFEDKIVHDYSSITCENEMKPEAILDRTACASDLENTYLCPAVKFDSSKKAVTFAVEHDMKMRLHTLVWHSQTPHWFFTEDYSDNGELVSREVMLARMENYIRQVLTYFDENYPELIYAVDVCNEAFDSGNGDANQVRMRDNDWYATVGDDYYYQAFVFARKYAPSYMKLFYNDYGCMYKTDTIIKRLQQAQDEGLIDGIGMQTHLDITDDIGFKFMTAVKRLAEAGYEIQLTEIDIGMDEVNDNNLNRQGRKYKALFSGLKKLKDEGYNITSVTLWGISDGNTWRTGKAPLLYTDKYEAKPAYLGALLDDSIVSIE